jgi:hypothetical protein
VEEYEKIGYIQVVTRDTQPGNHGKIHYLPHHAVVKESSTTTKLRVVFDGSTKSTNGIALNDLLQVGPTVQNEQYAIVVRFRTHKIVMTADIAKMYRQVAMHPEDMDLQRILWRYSQDEPIQCYKLTTVTYGTASAPYLATRCLQRLAEEEAQQFPLASKETVKDVYFDDIYASTDTIKEAL